METENLGALIEKAERLQSLLEGNPSILRFMELAKAGFADRVEPKADRLVGPTEVCRILKISSKTLTQWEKEHRILPRYTPNSKSKYWLSHVMALVKEEPYR